MSEVTITLESGADVDKVAAALESAGLVVENRLRDIGIVTGQVADADRERLKSVPGVADISGTQTIQIAPPEAPVW